MVATTHLRRTTRPVWSNRALVEHAQSKASLSTSLRDISEGHHWVAFWKDMQHIDQCSSCQVQFGASLLIPNSVEPHKCLGDNWGEVESWKPAQCAEADLVSAIAERTLLCASVALKLNSTLIPLTLMLRVAACLIQIGLGQRHKLGWKVLEEGVKAKKLPPGMLPFLRTVTRALMHH